MRGQKKIRHIMAMLALTGLLSGCSIGQKEIVFTTGLSNRELFKIDHKSCTISDGKLYLMNYQNIYGTAYGVDLWKNDTCRKELETYIKNLAVSELARVTCMDLLAEKRNLTLSKGETKKLEKAAEEYYDSLTKEEKNYSGATKSSVETLYHNYALAKKAYSSLTESVDDEVSDSEARVMKLQQIHVKKKAEADEIAKKLAAGNDFVGIASNYNKAGEIEQTVSRGELPKKVEKAAFALEDGEVSAMIHADEGYYFIKCINKFEEELTDINKKKIVAERETQAFQSEYNGLIERVHSILNDDVWNDVEIKQDAGIQTDSFFTIYEKYFQEEK